MTTAAELASYASSFPSFRNKIINGNFDIWQRETSQASSGYGSADRWNCLHSVSSKTASQEAFTLGQTDVPGNPKYYLRHVVSSVTGAGNLVVLNQRIEDVQTLAGQTATLSFWAKADSNKSIATELVQNFGSGGSPSSQVDTFGVTTHSLTTSWQKFTATVSIPSISGKTIGSDGNDYLAIIFWFEAGINFNSRTNSLGQQSGTFDIAQVQFEEGTVATQFEHRPYGTELSLAQRYFCKINFGSAPHAVNGSSLVIPHSYPTTMRVSPDLTETIVTSSGNQATGYPSFGSYGTDGFNCVHAPNISTGINIYANYTVIAKAEL